MSRIRLTGGANDEVYLSWSGDNVATEYWDAPNKYLGKSWLCYVNGREFYDGPLEKVESAELYTSFKLEHLIGVLLGTYAFMSKRFKHDSKEDINTVYRRIIRKSACFEDAANFIR